MDNQFDFDSSSDESDDGLRITNTSGPLPDEPKESAPWNRRPTYLEREEYRVLVAKLRTLDQHDTAHHLMVIVLLKRLLAEDYKRIAKRPLRKGWTAWPLPPEETVHAAYDSSSLPEEMIAQVHRCMTGQLRAQGKVVSVDDLADPVSQVFADTLMSKFTSVLRRLAQMRSFQGSTKASTIARMKAMSHLDVLTVLRHSDLLSPDALASIEQKSANLFGKPVNAACESTRRSPVDILEDISEEVKFGTGHWDMRGSKRRKIEIEEDTQTKSTPQDGNAAQTYRITDDPGQRFDKATRLIPAHLLKLENNNQ